MLPEILETYLSRSALPGWEIESTEFKSITTTIVIPAIREYENIRLLLNSLAENDGAHFSTTLVLFIINNSALSSGQIKDDNKKSIGLLNSIIEQNTSADDEFIDKVCKSGLQIGFVNASTAGKELPQKDAGVGLARKIGMDLALTLLDYNSQSKKILVCLDADCTVEKNYITEIVNNFNTGNLSAAYVNYAHKIDGPLEEQEAIICYEIFLRYYELCLQFAKSPFAFPTIGSTIACDYESYIKSEGMNKRKAAEDFYFLEKLAKNYPVNGIQTTTIYPSSRRSWRVPFGTGQRVNRFLAHVQDEYLLYNPNSFFILKEWLKIFSNTKSSANLLLLAAKEIDEGLYTFLVSQEFETDWQKILDNSKTDEQIQRQQIKWFDGFKTLKLIHYLRDNGYPPVNMFDALNIMLTEFKITLPINEPFNDRIPELEIQKKYLEILRTQLHG